MPNKRKNGNRRQKAQERDTSAPRAAPQPARRPVQLQDTLQPSVPEVSVAFHEASCQPAAASKSEAQKHVVLKPEAQNKNLSSKQEALRKREVPLHLQKMMIPPHTTLLQQPPVPTVSDISLAIPSTTSLPSNTGSSPIWMPAAPAPSYEKSIPGRQQSLVRPSDENIQARPKKRSYSPESVGDLELTPSDLESDAGFTKYAVPDNEKLEAQTVSNTTTGQMKSVLSLRESVQNMLAAAMDNATCMPSPPPPSPAIPVQVSKKEDRLLCSTGTQCTLLKTDQSTQCNLVDELNMNVKNEVTPDIKTGDGANGNTFVDPLQDSFEIELTRYTVMAAMNQLNYLLVCLGHRLRFFDDDVDKINRIFETTQKRWFKKSIRLLGNLQCRCKHQLPSTPQYNPLNFISRTILNRMLNGQAIEFFQSELDSRRKGNFNKKTAECTRAGETLGQQILCNQYHGTRHSDEPFLVLCEKSKRILSLYRLGKPILILSRISSTQTDEKK